MVDRVPLSDFSKRVKKRLIELDMTQRELAKEIGANEVYLTLILTNRRSGAKYRERINKVLGFDRAM